MNEIPLHKLNPGCSGVIVSVGETDGKALPSEHGDEAQAAVRRLRDLGLIPGTRIKCLHRSPLKDPVAYEVRGAVLALRKEDSANILVELVETKEIHACESKYRLTIALAGNPNVGKSTVFNTLTGLRQHTGNWAGKTVGKASGIWKIRPGTEKTTRNEPTEQEIRLVDIPGCYSLDSASPEEEVARDFLQSDECDGVLIVCDGTCLERNLILILQILHLTGDCAYTGTHMTETADPTESKVAVCINMMDQVRKRGLKIDQEKLQELLGVPVCMTESRKPVELRRKLENLVLSGWPQDTEEDLGRTAEPAASFDSAILVRQAEEIADAVICRTQEKTDSSRRLDRILTSPVTGFPVMALLLMMIFWITLKGAGYPSQALSYLLFSLEQPLYDLLESGLGLPAFFCEMVARGMYRVLAWVVSVMLPPMAIFFPLFTLLEDWGLLPRIAFNLDRCFHCCSASGKQALTMCMGLGCNASAVVGCRIMESERERLMAMLTNCLVPCNGRFPLLLAVITMYFAGTEGSGGLQAALMLTAVILLGIASTFLLSKILSLTLLKGMPSSFALELPPFRRPQLGKVIVRSVLDRTLFVLGRAVMTAAPAGILIYMLANLSCGSGDSSLLTAAADFLDPAGKAIGLDGVILMAFLLGLPASEIVMPMMMMIYMSQGTLTEVSDLTAFHQILSDHGWNGLTALNVLIFTLLHWPCATTLLSIKKESGSWWWTLAAVLAPLSLGVIFCAVTTAVYCKI